MNICKIVTVLKRHLAVSMWVWKLEISSDKIDYRRESRKFQRQRVSFLMCFENWFSCENFKENRICRKVNRSPRQTRNKKRGKRAKVCTANPIESEKKRSTTSNSIEAVRFCRVVSILIWINELIFKLESIKWTTLNMLQSVIWSFCNKWHKKGTRQMIVCDCRIIHICARSPIYMW